MIKHFKYHDIGVDSLNNKSHFHNEEYEILHILSGDGAIVIKNKLYELSENIVFFINGKDTHYTSPQTPNKYIRNKIIFSQKTLQQLSNILSVENIIENLFSNGGTAIVLTTETSAEIDKYFFNLSKTDKNTTNQNINIFINIFSIIDTALKSNITKAKRLKNKVTDILSYIDQNLSEKISLNDICEKVNLSKYYMCRKFKNSVGMTVMEYIEFSRISKAKELLINTDETISETAIKTGFDSAAYFSKIFKAHTGMTPTNYKKISR